MSKKYNGLSEDRIQQECYMWFWNTYPDLRGLLFAIPNGGKRSSQEARKFKLTGTDSGVSDMLFMYNSNTYCLELKTEVGYQSKNQKIWEDVIVKQGFPYFVIRSLEQFKGVIEKIISQD